MAPCGFGKAFDAVGVQQGHRHALHTGFLQPRHQTIDLTILQRLQHVAFVIKPLNWRLLSYQIRYVHRASRAEAALMQARSRANQEAARSAAQLERLARESSRFLTQALTREPSLRPTAAEFARVADEVLSACAPDEAA